LFPGETKSFRKYLDKIELLPKLAMEAERIGTLPDATSRHQPRRATIEVIWRAFDKADIEFIDENGGPAYVSRVGQRRVAKNRMT